jgi:hypothetical protein
MSGATALSRSPNCFGRASGSAGLASEPESSHGGQDCVEVVILARLPSSWLTRAKPDRKPGLRSGKNYW